MLFSPPSVRVCCAEALPCRARAPGQTRYAFDLSLLPEFRLQDVLSALRLGFGGGNRVAAMALEQGLRCSAGARHAVRCSVGDETLGPKLYALTSLKSKKLRGKRHTEKQQRLSVAFLA